MVKVTIGSNEYDAFISVADADYLLAADISRATGWALLNSDAKGRAIVSAARFMLNLPWCGGRPDPETDQPEPVPTVNALFAADLAANPSLAGDASGNSNVKRAKAGSAEVEFFAPVDDRPPLPGQLWNMLLTADLMCLGKFDDDPTLAGAIPFGTCGGSRPLNGRSALDWLVAEEDYD